MKTALKFNRLAIQNLVISIKTGVILAMITGFLYISYLGMSKPEPVKLQKDQVVIVTNGNSNLTKAKI